MNSIRIDPAAFDTNIFVYGVRGTPSRPACSKILFERISEFRLYVPKEIITELHRNLRPSELRTIYDALDQAKEVTFDYEAPPADLVAHYRTLGVKKGDAVIAAHLHSSGIRWLISENRHFLREIPDLPFTVLSAEEAVAELAAA